VGGDRGSRKERSEDLGEQAGGKELKMRGERLEGRERIG
jgi:hypothetical protein